MMTIRCDEYDKDEWFDVCRKLMPGLTQEEYEGMWNRFVIAKKAHEHQQGVS